MNEVITKYLDDRLEKGTFKASSIPTIKSRLKHFVSWFENDQKQVFTPAAVTPYDIRDFKNYLKECGNYSPTTRHNYIVNIKTFTKWLHSEGYIDYDPGLEVSLPNKLSPSPKWHSRKEYNAIKRELRRSFSVRNRAIVLSMLDGSLRPSEVAELRVGNVRLTERTGYVTIIESKWDRSREVKMSNDLRKVMSEWFGENPLIKRTSSFVFYSNVNSHISTRTVQHIVSLLKHKTQIDGLSCKSLRHTFGKMTLDACKDRVQVAMLMGHFRNDGTPNIESTLIYTMPGKSDMETTIERAFDIE